MRFAVFLGACALAWAQTADPAYEPLARAYEAVRVHDYDLAVSSFRKAIDAAPDRTAIRKDLAYLYLKIGENEPALEAFREIVLRDPADYQIALEYAFLCYESKRQGEARRIFDRIRKPGPQPLA